MTANPEDLKDEFKLIQESISKWDGYSLTIKNWAVTLWSITIIFILTQYYTLKTNSEKVISDSFYYLFLIPIGLIVAFWFFDAIFKKFQRFNVARSEAIQDYLNKAILQGELTNVEKEEFQKNFPLYDPVGRISRKLAGDFYKKEYEDITSILHCLLVRIIAYFYCVLLALTFIVIAIVSNNWGFYFLMIIPIIISIVSWKLCETGTF